MPIGILITLFRLLIFALLLCRQLTPQIDQLGAPPYPCLCIGRVGHEKGHPVGPSSRATRPAPSQKGASRRPVAWCDLSGGPAIRFQIRVVVDRFDGLR